jgi:hypothetical protein
MKLPLDTRQCANCGATFQCSRWHKKRFCTAECIRHLTRNKKHGLSGTPEHRNWRNMIDRCGNPKCKYYPRYGGRGIKVCERWLGPDGFANFYADMGPKPSPAHSIDRVNNDAGYEPGNCKWATKAEQARNRRPWSEWTYKNGAACSNVRQQS